MRTKDQKLDLVHRVDDLVAGFSMYLEVFKQENPFTPDQLRNHTNTTELRRQLGTVRAAISSQAFLNRLYLTLESWGMNNRGAKLVDCP